MQRKKILVVDDSKLIHKMFDVMLRPHTLVHAFDGQDGLQRLAEHPDVALVLLDVNMPRMNGLEFLAALKADQAFDEIPVAMITTEGKEEDTQRAMEAGAAAYIKKPFQAEAVLDLVTNLGD